MTNLDDERSFALLDSGGMGAQIAGFPHACAAAWAEAQKVSLPLAYRAVRSVVILGMGGSAISGDLARALGTNSASVPIEVVRGYHIPGYVDSNTLVIAISYSGGTEETLAAFSAAKERTASLIVVASGGKLQARALAAGIPHYAIRTKSQPRAALPHLYMPVLHALTTLYLIRCSAREIEQAVSFIADQAPAFASDVPTNENPAKNLARAFFGKIVSIYASEFLGEVARRWKTQINENSKQWAEFETLPEANHNAVVGYAHPLGNTDSICVIQLHSPLYHERTRIGMEAARELLDAASIANRLIGVQGPTPLAHQLFAILLGDYVSYYLAILNGVDPTPVANIDHVKARLAEAPTQVVPQRGDTKV